PLSPASRPRLITNGGDTTVTMFDPTSLAVIKKIPVRTGGLDGIMYDDFSDRIILTNHSRPIGTVVAIAPKAGDVVGTVDLEDNSPEGAASDGKGKIFVNNEGKSTIQVIDDKALKVLASWPLAPCEGPTGIAYDRATNRIFSGCGKTSVVIDPASGKVVATIANGDGVDALGWDASSGRSPGRGPAPILAHVWATYWLACKARSVRRTVSGRSLAAAGWDASSWPQRQRSTVPSSSRSCRRTSPPA